MKDNIWLCFEAYDEDLRKLFRFNQDNFDEIHPSYFIRYCLGIEPQFNNVSSVQVKWDRNANIWKIAIAITSEERNIIEKYAVRQGGELLQWIEERKMVDLIMSGSDISCRNDKMAEYKLSERNERDGIYTSRRNQEGPV